MFLKQYNVPGLGHLVDKLLILNLVHPV